MRYMSVARERPPAERIVRPFQDFVDKQSSGGIVLIAATAIALANAGLPLGGNILGALAEPVALGILFGLVFGKQIGVMLFSWLAVRSGLAELPEGIG
jgi:NhaA family Na+:H+ antiporter